DLFNAHDIEAAVVGEVIEEKVFKIKHEDKIWADIPVDALDADAPVYYLKSKEAKYYQTFQNQETETPKVTDHGEMIKTLLTRETIASKEWVYKQFDSNKDNKTLKGPGSGAAVVQINDQDKAIAITTDSNSRYIYLDPKVGGQIAVAEAARNIVAAGAKPLAITDGLNYGNPTNEEVFWQMEESIDGISAACKVLDVPVISGNVSMYNQSEGEAIYPTPIIGMVGLFESLKDITLNSFHNADDLVYLIGDTYATFGGSEIQKVVSGEYSGKAPNIDLDIEKNRQANLLTAIQQGLIESAEDVSEGGLAVCAAESVIRSENLGAELTLSGEAVEQLYSETQSRFIVTVNKTNKDAFEKAFEDA